ncbi:MAG TPA: hypothetical protein VNA24_05290 [Hyalangium sp.]|jgi:hypothetical protein|nr:hypothetical protein [Hyalangium sp.]
MRYAMLVGWAWLGASLVACAGVSREVQLLDEHPVGASSGAGGGAEIDTGEWATLARTPQSEQARRQLYEQVAEELGLEEASITMRAEPFRAGEAVGGGGRAGGEQRSCAEVLMAQEPATVISGTLDYAQDGVVTVNVPGKGPVKLRADESTCAVQARQALLLESLFEGTEVSVSYVMEGGLPTARVVRAEPQRYTH